MGRIPQVLSASKDGTGEKSQLDPSPVNDETVEFPILVLATEDGMGENSQFGPSQESMEWWNSNLHPAVRMKWKKIPNLVAVQ